MRNKCFYIVGLIVLLSFSFCSRIASAHNKYHAIYHKLLEEVYDGSYPVIMCTDGEDEILQQATMFWFQGSKKKVFLDEWFRTLIKGKIYQTYSENKNMLFKNIKQLNEAYKRNDNKYEYPVIILGPIGFKNENEVLTAIMVQENDDNNLHIAYLKKIDHEWKIRFLWGDSGEREDKENNNNTDRKKSYNFTEKGVSQIYNQVFNKQIMRKPRRLYVIYDTPQADLFMELGHLFRKKEFRAISEYFQNSPTEDIEIKREYFDYPGRIRLLSPYTEKIFNDLDDVSDEDEKRPISFSKIAFSRTGDQAYLFYNQRQGRCLETSFCYLEKEDNNWELKLTFTTSIACLLNDALGQ